MKSADAPKSLKTVSNPTSWSLLPPLPVTTPRSSHQYPYSVISKGVKQEILEKAPKENALVNTREASMSSSWCRNYIILEKSHRICAPEDNRCHPFIFWTKDVPNDEVILTFNLNWMMMDFNCCRVYFLPHHHILHSISLLTLILYPILMDCQG